MTAWELKLGSKLNISFIYKELGAHCSVLSQCFYDKQIPLEPDKDYNLQLDKNIFLASK